MKVLAINSSPLKSSGNTDLILDEFLKGVESAGAEVEKVYAKDLKIRPCLGKLVCWIKTPGVCCQNDDMAVLLNKLKDADVWVFATPVYWDGMTGTLKNLFDRMLPLLQPYIEEIDGHHRHALQSGVSGGKIVLISTCGFWELDNFDPLVSHIKAVSKNIHREFAGALLRPHGALIKYWVKTTDIMENVTASIRKAGIELVNNEIISQETMDEVSSQLVTREKYASMINDNFERLTGKKY